jgi:hypothetical protein
MDIIKEIIIYAFVTYIAFETIIKQSASNFTLNYR